MVVLDKGWKILHRLPSYSKLGSCLNSPFQQLVHSIAIDHAINRLMPVLYICYIGHHEPHRVSWTIQDRCTWVEEIEYILQRDLSWDLCHSLALGCNTYLYIYLMLTRDPCISPLLACQLITLNKNPCPTNNHRGYGKMDNSQRQCYR